MQIGNRQIGPLDPPYIIAEIGVNHDGSVDRALELTRAAHAAGADAVKLQLFTADLLMSRASKLAAYQQAAGENDPLDMLRRLELSIRQMEPVVALAHRLGIHAIVTCFSVDLVDEAERLPWDAYKTASPDIIHKPLLDRLAATGKPLIVSTGASTLDEVQRAVEWLRPAHERLALMQCVSSYPTRREDAELGGIQSLRQIFAGPVGYSDHTANDVTSYFAARAGALLLEKHLTYDKQATGPDHAASLEPREFASYVQYARESHREHKETPARLDEPADPKGAALPGSLTQSQIRHMAFQIAGQSRIGAAIPNPVKRVLDIEQDVRRVSRQSITTKNTLPAGHVIRREDLTFKRPGTGIEPFRIDEVIGKKAARAVNIDMPIMPEDLA